MVGFKEWVIETEIRGRRVERKFTSLRGAEETKEAWEQWGHTVKMTERDGAKDVIGVLLRGPAWRTGGRRAEAKGTV